MGKACIIYPRYMDSEASLKDGRRLGLEHSVPRDKRYPKGAVEGHDLGYIKVDKETIKTAGGKLELLKSLQKHIVEARQEVIDTLKQPQE